MNLDNKPIISLSVLFLFSFLLLIGGLDMQPDLTRAYGAVAGVLLTTFAALSVSKFRLPKHFLVYLLFLLSFSISLVWSNDLQVSLGYLVLYSTFALFWIALHNLKRKKPIGHLLIKSIILVTLIFSAIYLHLSTDDQSHTITPRGFISSASSYRSHSHLGDIWAIALIFISAQFISSANPTVSALVGIGLIFLVISKSRSAYLALLVGIFYLLNSSKKIKKHISTVLTVFTILLIGIFLIIGLNKSLLGSRPYYVQSIVGLFRHPLGVGVGKFDLISQDPANHIFGLSGFSKVTHNIILEFISGMGIYGFIFAWWLYLVLKDIINLSKSKTRAYEAAFLALTVLFLFDTVYFLPTMIWLWGMVLGLISQDDKKSSLKYPGIVIAFIAVATLASSFWLTLNSF